MENSRMLKTAGVLDKIAGILGKVALVCGIVCLIFVVLAAVLGEAVFVPSSNTLELGFVEFSLSGDYQSVSPAVRLFTAASLLLAALGCFVFHLAMKYLGAVLGALKAGRPFEESVCLNLRRLGFVSLVGGFLSELFKWGQQLLLLRAFPLDKIFASPAITGMQINFIMDMGFVVVAAVFFLLSWVFDYGCRLQRQSDETL